MKLGRALRNISLDLSITHLVISLSSARMNHGVDFCHGFRSERDAEPCACECIGCENDLKLERTWPPICFSHIPNG
jgi:hypothetical protein